MQNHNENGTIAKDDEIIDLTGLSLTSSDGSTRDFQREMSEDTSMHWYQDQNGSHPFALSAKTRAPGLSPPSFTQVEFFPWGETPLEQLWDGENYYTRDDSGARWSQLISKWRSTAAVCGGKVVRIIQTSPRHQGAALFQVALPAECRFTVFHVKWALNPWNLHPLLVYVHSSVLHIFDVEAREFLGCIRGHGGDITSIGVHQWYPHLVFTTSRDCTTRIYDFRIMPSTEEGQDTSQRRIKDQFGLPTGNSREESALGKCVVILTGGRSGGHEATVLGADFHASLPLIATCGMDHALRIWHLRPALFLKDRYLAQGTAAVYREDKPLFSSTMIHDARIMSVHWLSHEILLSHSASRISCKSGKLTQADSGTLTVWQWLSVGRFFPPDASIHREPPLRGCISDYRESSSFKLISKSRPPVEASRVFLNRNIHRPPLILIPVRSKIILINACHLPARPPPRLIDDRDLPKPRQAKKARVLENAKDELRTDIEGWILSVAIGEDLEDEDVVACDMSPDGQRVAAVGAREGVWMWSAC